MQPIEKHILVLGMPESGKSSFIHALDEVLRNPVKGQALRSWGLADDRTYLEKEKDSFHAAQELDRTDRQTPNTSVELWFEHPASGSRGRLLLPDKRGETFRDQWINRKWEKNLREGLPNLDGALVFVRVDQKAQNQEMLGKFLSGKSKAANQVPWDMKNASAQTQLVDNLQFINESRLVSAPLRLMVLISAWDIVRDDQTGKLPKNPLMFLEREWALLAQYLRANRDFFEWGVNGVSAYGGVPEQKKDGKIDKVSKLGKIPAHKRVVLADGEEMSQDISRPIRWVLNLV